jgi:hypothetical protein
MVLLINNNLRNSIMNSNSMKAVQLTQMLLDRPANVAVTDMEVRVNMAKALTLCPALTVDCEPDAIIEEVKRRHSGAVIA